MLHCLSEGSPFTTAATLMSLTLAVTQTGRYYCAILKIKTAVIHNTAEVEELLVNGTTLMAVQ